MKMSPDAQREAAMTFFLDAYGKRWTDEGFSTCLEYEPRMLWRYLDDKRNFSGDWEDHYTIAYLVERIVRNVGQPGMLSRGVHRDWELCKSKRAEDSTSEAADLNPANTSPILQDAPAKIVRFNSQGLHYNIVANRVYAARDRWWSPFDKNYQRFVVTALVAFDMERLTGENQYALDGGHFAERLNAKLKSIESLLEPILDRSLDRAGLIRHAASIKRVYDLLSAPGPGQLHSYSGMAFHVGASRILHFLNPDLFITLEGRAARAFKVAWQVGFSDTPRPGYSGQRYLECMRCAQADIRAFGADRFRAMEYGAPMARIYDKLTYVTGS